ncbi:MAG: hypothetical protein ABIT58_08870 [Ferruginibacter sp.]
MRLLFTIFITVLSCNSRNDILEKYGNGQVKHELIHINKSSYYDREYYADGKIKKEKYFINGKQEGIEMFFMPGGSKSMEVHFQNGMKNGSSKGFHANGRIAFEAVAKDGEFEGVSTWYFDNGNIKFKGSRHLGKDTGMWYFYEKKDNRIVKSYNYSNEFTVYYDQDRRTITEEEWKNIEQE